MKKILLLSAIVLLSCLIYILIRCDLSNNISYIKIIKGEPGMVQNVNSSADLIISSNWEKELIHLVKTLTEEYAPKYLELSKPSKFASSRLLPSDAFPNKFHSLGWFHLSNTPQKPKLLFSMSNEYSTPCIAMSWGNMRHSVIIFNEIPKTSPKGEYIRKVCEQIFVIAHIERSENSAF